LLKPLSLLLDKYNLRIIKAVSKDIHGSSMRLLISHKGELGKAFQPCESVKQLMDKENFNIEDYEKWAHDIKLTIAKGRKFVLDLKNKGHKIAAFGAAAKGCIFLNAANLTCNEIEYIIDDTDLKQNMYMPGTGIQILSRKELKENPVDYIIILAHNFAEHIMKSLEAEFTGKFVVLLPEPKTF
jgi:hypothetical protein